MTATEASRRKPKAAPAATLNADQMVADYRLAFQSRQASLMGRKEVLSGKAKFGIFGDGKEVAQVALARSFRPGDFRAGYYRDQTWMFASGMSSIPEFFAQLYAITDLELEPASAGRLMNGHFSTHLLNPDGSWRPIHTLRNSACDVSPTASQMPRLVGLAHASSLYRNVEGLAAHTGLSNNGDEVVFGTIGNASCAEGMFFEALNAAGVLQVPLVMSVWDDGYGISVPNDLQVTKGSISQLLAGLARDKDGGRGFDIHVVPGWDYTALQRVYAQAAHTARTQHVPALVHVTELTQPQGHSTSGSHERYKSPERLAWEADHDCLTWMRKWMVSTGVATDAQLQAYEEEDAAAVRNMQRDCYARYRAPLDAEAQQLCRLVDALADAVPQSAELRPLAADIRANPTVFRRDMVRAASQALIVTVGQDLPQRRDVAAWRQQILQVNAVAYGDNLLSSSERAALRVPVVPATYAEPAPTLNGFEVINRCFASAMERMPNLVIFGEDVGRLGDVNQGCAGLQERFGALRVADTGIRECTIVGQGLGMAMRGLRPVVEVQYLDYLLYALQILSDDVATLRWRTRGTQMAPMIVRTRGHRLEGVWHSGSPMAGIISLVRGMHVCVPRDFVQAAGMYNTLLAADDPAIVVEVLNGYRLKERLPQNMAEFTVPLGTVDVVRPGQDVTVVTYGACVRICLEAAATLERLGIHAEVVDVQTLLPFDLEGGIAKSIVKTSRVLFVDEDVPGGTTAYMMRQVLEVQGAFTWLDSPPATLPATEHRPAYGSDGDYWSKPSRETVVEAVYGLMREADPARFPPLF